MIFSDDLFRAGPYSLMLVLNKDALFHCNDQFVISIAHFYRDLVIGATTLSIMTFSIMTFSIMTFSIMMFSIMTFSIMTFSITTLSITTLSIRTLKIIAVFLC
jgi:hypothetical protein